ncbi:NACHT domain-containing protein [Streptomyces odonnellii]|uniref:NACHT domain-containing protein n=1 Tax=Streptomyces odonnellii TaxID=1417980 RepID=UPI0006266D6C|nr:hypothetical protein [Streptomyces odonnellii]
MPVLALFGERGAGKSVTLLQERQALRSMRQEPQWVNLGRHQTEAQATSALTVAFTAPETGEWWVILDSLDEGLNVLPALGSLIADRIDSLAADKRGRLRLRISCRTGRWPDTLQDTLVQYWGPSEIQHAVLTPLSAPDIAVAAEGTGLDAGEFVRELRQRGLTQLAKAPVTLMQLLEYRSLHGALPASAADAYLQACVQLCSETRRPADIHERRVQPPGERLLPVAARVAAVMQFGAHVVLYDDWQRGADGEISLAELEGGHEPGPLGSLVPCTTDELRRLTESHLFEPVGLFRWSFTHRSYQEFLAAHYLSAHQTDPQAQAGLLWVGEGTARHVYPAHREVAAWRSSNDPTLFEDLLRDDPEVLLLADLPARSADDRARVVEAVFDLVQHDDTIDIDHTSLHRLDRPRLSEQLVPRLRPDVDGIVLYTALGIARRCPHPELTDALLQVAETTDLPEELRAIALRSIASLEQTGDQTVDRIRQLATGDPSPEVVAAALNRLWPIHLTVRELLDLFRDSAPDYIGRAWALRSDIPAQLTAAQTTQALLWARDMLQQPPSQRSIVLAISLITRAINLASTTGLPGLERPETFIGQALIALGAHSETLHSLDGHTEHQALGDALRAQHSLRRALTLYLLTHTTEDEFVRVLIAAPRGCLTTYDDAFHWMDHWEELADVPLSLARMIVSITPPTDPELRAHAAVARAAHPTLRQATTDQWDEEPAPEFEQEPDNTPADSRIYSETGLREALAAVHMADPDTIRRAWGTVIEQMRRTRDGSPPPHLLAEPLLTWAHHAPSRPAKSSDLDSALQAAALHVLATVPPPTAQLLAHGRRANPWRLPELSAFAVLHTPAALPRATPAHWASWTLALATIPAYTSPAQAVREAFLPHCAEQAGPALAPLLSDILQDANTDTITTHHITRALTAHALPEVLDTLIAWADHSDRDLDQWHSVISALAFDEHPGAVGRLRAALETDASALTSPSDAQARWLLAAHTLLFCPALPSLWPFVHTRLQNDVLAEAYLDRLDQRPPHHEGRPHHLAALAEEALADLYLLFADHAGPEVLDPPLRTGWTGDAHAGDLARSIPALLQAKNTAHAAHQLRRMAAWTGLRLLRRLARLTAASAAETSHISTTPSQLIALASQSKQRRWVTDEGHLLALVIEALDRFQDVLRRPNGLAVSLWNRSHADIAKAEWWPCWEDDLSDILAIFLLQDIGGERVVVNREVQLDRPGLSGRRTDIQIEAFAPPGSGHDPVKVVIECKGCWNRTLPTALEQQLVDRYLNTPHTAGILLTGYFHCDHWTTQKRSCPVSGHTLDSVHKYQQEQAQTQRALKGVSVAAFTLDCTLPSAISRLAPGGGENQEC